ncbi:MAG TPA: squalene synthase HpnC [Pseudorhodoplanes sp.]|nr:squalene synthase HpnC [Pseudorhodoplanes sp.]
MTTMTDITPHRTHRSENFPVASALIHPRHRETVLAFYWFARASDDIADHSSLPESEKFARLQGMEDTLLGRTDSAADAVPLRDALARRDLAPRHPLDLLTAFRMDVTKRRYRDWDDLMHYCAYSAMPVGRFVLDVHGESRATWPANDALCAALQVINHLQDCGADYRNIDRVYIPQDALARHGLTVEALAADKASPQLRQCLQDLTQRTSALLQESEPFSAQIRDLRLCLEVSVIQQLATRLTGLLMMRDPLSERVHLNKAEIAATTMSGIARAGVGRWFGAGANARQM